MTRSAATKLPSYRLSERERVMALRAISYYMSQYERQALNSDEYSMEDTYDLAALRSAFEALESPEDDKSFAEYRVRLDALYNYAIGGVE